ncbi:MAG: F0F1 ATP synthase subunit B [Fuerstiella sp.]
MLFLHAIVSMMQLTYRNRTALAVVAGLFCLSTVASYSHADEAHPPAEKADSHEHSDAAGDADADAGDGHETGVPKDFKADLALWSLITFVLFLFVMKKLAWGPMIQGLDQREAGIRSAIAEAQENQRKSHALLADYEQKLKDAEKTVAEMVAEAKRDAERTSQDIVAKAEADVTALRDRATSDISQAKNTALAEVFSSVNSQVAAATERVLGRALNDDDQERLIQEALAEISS